MLQITLRYIPFSPLASFLMIKQTEVEGYRWYLPVFYTHVYTSVFVLIAGFTQFNNKILKNYKTVHRYVGYLYVVTVLLFSAPSGFVMGFVANGGPVAKSFFIVLATLWWWYTYKALITARSRDFKAHRAFMIRSFALTCSAIMLRLWKLILVKLFALAPMDVYVIVSGLSWVPNLLFAEWYIRKFVQRKSLKQIFKPAKQTV